MKKKQFNTKVMYNKSSLMRKLHHEMGNMNFIGVYPNKIKKHASFGVVTNAWIKIHIISLSLFPMLLTKVVTTFIYNSGVNTFIIYYTDTQDLLFHISRLGKIMLN